MGWEIHLKGFKYFFPDIMKSSKKTIFIKVKSDIYGTFSSPN